MTGLADRDREVLAEMARAGQARVAFQGLRRRLNVHQQALARVLRRLQLAGLVARDDSGYRLTDRGQAAANPVAAGMTPDPVRPVAQMLLPPRLTGQEISAHLSRRWFDGLRWYGRSDGPDETILIWLTEPEGTQVRVRVIADVLRIEVDALPDSPEREFVVARGLLGALAELYGSTTLTAAHRFGAGLAA